MGTSKENARRKKMKEMSAKLQADSAAASAGKLEQTIKEQAVAPAATLANDNNDPSYEYRDDPTTVAVNDALEQRNQYFADMILQRKAEIDAEKAEYDAEIARAKKASQWTAGTEAVNALVNLIGVGNGAANQQQHTVSRDWMQKADSQIQERKNYMRQAREKLLAANGQLAQSQMDQRNQMLSYQIDKENRDYERAFNQLKFNYQAQKDAIEAADKSRKTDIDAYKAETDRIEAENAAGVSQSTIARNQAQAGYYQARAASEGKDSTGAASRVRVTFPGTGAGGADETIEFNNLNSFLNTISVNMDAANWDEADREAVANILNPMNLDSATQKRDKLMPYLAKSPRMMEKLRQTAAQQPAAPAGTAGSPQAVLDDVFGDSE